MLEKFITSLSDEQKQQLLEALQNDLHQKPKPEPFVLKEEFVSSIKDSSKKETKISVDKTEKFNTFVDDGTESKGEEFDTPQIELAARRRPSVKKVTQVCRNCNKSFKVHPSHARDMFICDKCIGAR